VSTATRLPVGPISSPKDHIKITLPRSNRRTDRRVFFGRAVGGSKTETLTHHSTMRSNCIIYSTVEASENACGEIVDGAQWCARPSRESRRVRLRMSSRTGDPTRAARTAVERRRRIERPAARMTVAKERGVSLLGGGTCTGGPSAVYACAPRKSNIQQLYRENTPSPAVRAVLLFIPCRRPSARQQLFISENAYFPRAKNLTYNNTLRAAVSYYYYTVFEQLCVHIIMDDTPHKR